MKCKNSHGQLCAIFAIVILLNVPASLFATTYTAVLSGDWTSALTWGGTAPPTTISGEDQIIIAANVTVNMDTHVELSLIHI